MRKIVTVIAALTAVASGVAVLQLKATVQRETDSVRDLVRQIHNDKEAIRVLEAEWAYQTAPSALQERSIKFLALMPPKAGQIVSSATVIPFRPNGIEVGTDPGVLLPAEYNDDPVASKQSGAPSQSISREKGL